MILSENARFLRRKEAFFVDRARLFCYNLIYSFGNESEKHQKLQSKKEGL
jgi:hypothetical protein